LTADDILIKRGIEHKAPRDNLIFEIGLFTGRLGRGRAFVVHPRDEPIEFPSDFNGTTLINFQMERADGNLQAAVGPACTRIKRAMGI
jgi:predicted nucleotide-binding protein